MENRETTVVCFLQSKLDKSGIGYHEVARSMRGEFDFVELVVDGTVNIQQRATFPFKT